MGEHASSLSEELMAAARHGAKAYVFYPQVRLLPDGSRGRGCAKTAPPGPPVNGGEKTALRAPWAAGAEGATKPPPPAPP